MKIAITGVTGFRNRGVEALVVPILERLLKKYPNAKIQIASWSTTSDALSITSPQVSFVEDHYLKCGRWSPLRSVRPKSSLASRVLKRAARELKLDTQSKDETQVPDVMPFDVPDILLVSGGDLFSSDYGTQSLRHFTQPILWSRSQGIPCVLLGQSVGIFKSDEDAEIWRQAAGYASAITLRESDSLKYLASSLDYSDSKLSVTADTAFLLVPDTSIVEQCKWFDDSPFVAVSISQSICKWTGSNYESHLGVWKRLIRKMLDEWGVRVALIPHVHEEYSDDRLLCTRIARELGFDSRLRVFAEDLTASEYKGIISKSELVIAERMHAAIAGFSTGVCTVPIGYSIKARGITAMMLDGSEFVTDNVAIALEDFLDFERSYPLIEELWKKRGDVSQVIRNNLNSVVARAESNFDVIDQFLN